MFIRPSETWENFTLLLFHVRSTEKSSLQMMRFTIDANREIKNFSRREKKQNRKSALLFSTIVIKSFQTARTGGELAGLSSL